MKSKLLLYLLIICNGNLQAQASFPSADSVINYLNDSWNWTQSIGGITGGTVTPSTSGYTRALVITRINGSQDSIRYQLYHNGSLIMDRRGRVTFGPSTIGNCWQLNVNYQPMFTFTISVYEADPVNMAITNNCADCTMDHYTRQSPSTGLEDFQNRWAPTVYPNPVRNILQFQTGSGNIVKRAALSDMNGREYAIVFNDDQSINTSGLEPGLYIIRFEINKKFHCIRFVKE